MYLIDAPKWSRVCGNSFSFLATTSEIQSWIQVFSELDFVVYREEEDERGWLTANTYEIQDLVSVVMKSIKEPISYFGPRDFIATVGLKRHYPPGEGDFGDFMTYNGMIRLYHSMRHGLLRTSILSVVYKVVNFNTMHEYINDDAKRQFAKLKRHAQKHLIYHTLLPAPPHPINELVPATAGAIKAHKEECNWLPGPKKEVKPRARKKKA